MITPFLNFDGRAGEAIDFYEKVFAAKDKRVLRYKDSPPNPYLPVNEKTENYVLHGEMTISGTRVNFSDTQGKVQKDGMITLALELSSTEEVVRMYNELKEGGEVLMECGPQFFSPMYAWIKDKFGIGWQISCRAAEAD